MKKYITAVFILLVAGLSLYYASSNFRKESKSVKDTGSSFPTNAQNKNTPDNWQSYTHETLEYSIYYPENFKIESNGDYSILISKQSPQPSFGPANFIYVSVVPPGQPTDEGEIYNYNQAQFKKLPELEIGEHVSLADTDQPELNEWFTYTRVDNTEIDGHPVKSFENNKPWEFPSGTTEVRFIFEDSGNIYLMGYYYGGEGVQEPLDPREAVGIISSFRLK
jgi:hypothetical protein